MNGPGESPSKRQVFQGFEPRIVFAVFVVLSSLVLLGWSLYYNHYIEVFNNDIPEAMTQTGILSTWFIQLLSCQIGCAAFLVSLGFVMIKFSTSAYSIRVLKSIINPLEENKGIIWSGVIIYGLTVLMCLILAMLLSFGVLELPDLQTPWGFRAILLLLILCVVAFEILGLFFARTFSITQSDYIIKKELNQIDSIYNNRMVSNNECKNWDYNEIERSLQLIFNVINSAIQQHDSRSSEYGINALSEKMKEWIEKQGATVSDIEQDITKNYIRRLTNSAKAALLLGDELTAIRIIEAIEGSVLGIYAERKGLTETEECFPSHMKLLIESYSNLGQFSVERNYIRSALGCIRVLNACNQMKLLIESYSNLGQFSVERNYIRSALGCIRVLNACNQELFSHYVNYVNKSSRPIEPPGDTTEQSLANENQTVGEPNLYDLSVMCVKSASLVSQIADKQNYETLVVGGAEEMSQMHTELCDFLEKEHPGLSSSTSTPNLPKTLLSHYIWSIMDAGVSAANSRLEWGAIKYIECLEGFGKNIFGLSDKYNGEDDIKTIARQMTHTSTAIRDIGQQLARGKFQEGSIKAMSSIRKLACKMLTRDDMMWVYDNHTRDKDHEKNKDLGEDITDKLAFVRAVWNIKDVGRSAAESGIEKAVVLAADELYILLKEALQSDKSWAVPKNEQQDGSKIPKKTEGLLSIGEGFYEISMITREKRLQDALNKIIYYNVISVWSLVNDKKDDYDKDLVLDTYLKTFVDLQLVDELTEGNIQAFFDTLTLDEKLRSYEAYKGYIGDFSKKVCGYSQKSSQQSQKPDNEVGKTGMVQEPLPPEESAQNNNSHEGNP